MVFLFSESFETKARYNSDMITIFNLAQVLKQLKELLVHELIKICSLSSPN